MYPGKIVFYQKQARLELLVGILFAFFTLIYLVSFVVATFMGNLEVMLGCLAAGGLFFVLADNCFYHYDSIKWMLSSIEEKRNAGKNQKVSL